MIAKLFKKKQYATPLEGALASQYNLGGQAGIGFIMLGISGVGMGMSLHERSPILSVLALLVLVGSFWYTHHYRKRAGRAAQEVLAQYGGRADTIASSSKDDWCVDEENAPCIPGTPYRADCAVGQLRPTGMRPCSPGPSMTWRNVGNARIQALNLGARYLDQENLCETHSLPTGAECERRLADLNAKAELQLATWLNPEESRWNRGEARKAAHWLQTRANAYRRRLYRGWTSDEGSSATAAPVLVDQQRIIDELNQREPSTAPVLVS